MDDQRIYSVVINHEEQYRIWPKEVILPRGWKAIGKYGTQQECLEYIKEVWSNTRPLTLREMTNRDTKE
jgi:MbtH protein